MFRIDLAIFTFYVVMYYRKKGWRWTFLGSVSVNLLGCASQSRSVVGVQLIPGDGSARHGAQGATDSTVMDEIKWLCTEMYQKIVSTCFYPSDRLPNQNPISGHKPFLKIIFRPLTLRCLQWMPRQTASCSLRRMSLPQHLDDEHHQIHGQRPTSSRNLEHLDISW